MSSHDQVYRRRAQLELITLFALVLMCASFVGMFYYWTVHAGVVGYGIVLWTPWCWALGFRTLHRPKTPRNVQGFLAAAFSPLVIGTIGTAAGYRAAHRLLEQGGRVSSRQLELAHDLAKAPLRMGMAGTLGLLVMALIILHAAQHERASRN